MVDVILKDLSPLFEGLYAKVGRPSIAPEKLLPALLLQVLYSVRSERLLMNQLDDNLLFRWFMGLSMDDVICDTTVQQESGSASRRRHRSGLNKCSFTPGNNDSCPTSIPRCTGP